MCVGNIILDLKKNYTYKYKSWLSIHNIELNGLSASLYSVLILLCPLKYIFLSHSLIMQPDRDILIQ